MAVKLRGGDMPALGDGADITLTVLGCGKSPNLLLSATYSSISLQELSVLLSSLAFSPPWQKRKAQQHTPILGL